LGLNVNIGLGVLKFLKGLKLIGGYGSMKNWKLQSIYWRINIRSITNNPWLQRMGKDGKELAKKINTVFANKVL
jgi:hypothetical protein